MKITNLLNTAPSIIQGWNCRVFFLISHLIDLLQKFKCQSSFHLPHFYPEVLEGPISDFRLPPSKFGIQPVDIPPKNCYFVNVIHFVV